jgi:hypothetical protein
MNKILAGLKIRWNRKSAKALCSSHQRVDGGVIPALAVIVALPAEGGGGGENAAGVQTALPDGERLPRNVLGGGGGLWLGLLLCEHARTCGYISPPSGCPQLHLSDSTFALYLKRYRQVINPPPQVGN